MVNNHPDLSMESIAKAEHIDPATTGDNVAAKKVAFYEWDTGSQSWARGGLTKTERYDYSSSTVIYTGTALVNTADASLGWTITKYDLTDTSNSSGKVATDVSWTNRTSGSYA